MNNKYLNTAIVVITLLFSTYTKAGLITENWIADISSSDTTAFTAGQTVSWSVVYDSDSLVMHEYSDATGNIERTWDARCPSGHFCNTYTMFSDALFDVSSIYDVFAAHIPLNFSDSDVTISNYSRAYTDNAGTTYYDMRAGNTYFYLQDVGSNNGSFIYHMRDGINHVNVQSQFNITNMRQGSISVPEPSTLVIFALGIISLASRRFNKKS